jgi:hypothetical protein
MNLICLLAFKCFKFDQKLLKIAFSVHIVSYNHFHSLLISSLDFPVNGHWLFITLHTTFLALSGSSGMKK